MSESYEVRQGDCISSIAFEHGFFWETVWNHANNADLKQKRKDPNVLMEGDVVHIPDLTPKEESGGTEQTHRFRLKGVPAKMKVRLLIDDEPRANEPYKLLIDDVFWREDVTDNEGFVEQPIPPNAHHGKLILGEGDTRDVYEFGFGTMDPLDGEEGIRKRLLDMGYDAEDDLSAAVREFQKKQGLQETGTVDSVTRSKIKEKFGQ